MKVLSRTGANGSHACYINPDDFNVALVSQCTVAAFSMAIYLILLLLSLSSLKGDNGRYITSMKGTSLLFLIGALIISINVFSNEENTIVRELFRISSGVIIGIVLELIGVLKFFVSPAVTGSNRGTRALTIGARYPSLGAAIGIMTFPLVIMELFIAFGDRGLDSEDTKQKMNTSERRIFIAGVITYIVQKVVQALVYIHLRLRNVRPEKRYSAIFFLRILALFNFTMWLDSIANSDFDLLSSTLVYGPAFNIPATIYEAILIDYRLLCAIIFLEHSLELTAGEEEKNDNIPNVISGEEITARERTFQSYGYFIGVACVTMQIIQGLQYIKELKLNSSLHAMGVTDSLLLLVSGSALMKINTLQENNVERRNTGIEIMVSGMGAVGFLHWTIKATLTFYWMTAFPSGEMRTYFGCQATQYALRGFGALLLISLFLKVKVESITAEENRALAWNHFLVPVIMMGSLSSFTISSIDQYVGEINTRIRCENLGQSLALLFLAGPPLYLGLCIHLFIHFFIIHRKMSTAPVKDVQRRNSVTEPLLSPIEKIGLVVETE